MSQKRTIKTVIAIAVIASAVAWLLYKATRSSWAYYCSVDEFVEKQLAVAPDKTAGNLVIRLAGYVKNDSIKYNPDNMQLDFELAGPKNSLTVRYHGSMPKNFAPAKEIIAEGTMAPDGIFRAKQILTRCESKYRAKLYENQTSPFLKE